MKKSKICLTMALFFMLTLLAGCGAAAPSGPDQTPQEEAVQEQPETAVPEEVTGEEEPAEEPAEVSMRTEEVFDRTQDAGKLTARFFHVRAYVSDTAMRKSGDHTLLTSPDGKIMLIDCGTPTAGPLVADALKQLGITHIDYLVFSHTHADHIGGASEILANFDVGQIYMNFDTSDEEGGLYYDRLMTAIELHKVPVERVHEGFTFKFGEEVDVKVYNPPADYDYLAVPDGVEQRNNSSLTMKLTYKDSSFFFGGDNYYRAETRMIETYGSELESGLVKMDHHGYMESNSLEWIKTVKPKVAVATFGADATINNMYLATGAKTFYVYQDGSIYVSTAGDGKYTVITEENRTSKVLKGKMNEDGHYLIG